MLPKLFIYGLALVLSTFTVSGLNINSIIKKNHIWEARFFTIILIISMTYLISNFTFDIVDIIKSSL